MELYLVTQDMLKDYDQYDAIVVAAETEEDARTIHPSLDEDDHDIFIQDGRWRQWSDYWQQEEWYIKGTPHLASWPEAGHRTRLVVKHLGATKEPRGVILASFNAG